MIVRVEALLSNHIKSNMLNGRRISRVLWLVLPMERDKRLMGREIQ